MTGPWGKNDKNEAAAAAAGDGEGVSEGDDTKEPGLEGLAGELHLTKSVSKIAPAEFESWKKGFSKSLISCLGNVGNEKQNKQDPLAVNSEHFAKVLKASPAAA